MDLSEKKEPSKRNERFLKSARILKRPHFLKVQRQKLRYYTRTMIVVVLRTETPIRFGFTVSKKVGNAVVRNKCKRRLREIVRRNKEVWPSRVDVVVIAKSRAASATFEELKKDLFRWANWFHKNHG